MDDRGDLNTIIHPRCACLCHSSWRPQYHNTPMCFYTGLPFGHPEHTTDLSHEGHVAPIAYRSPPLCSSRRLRGELLHESYLRPGPDASARAPEWSRDQAPTVAATKTLSRCWCHGGGAGATEHPDMPLQHPLPRAPLPQHPDMPQHPVPRTPRPPMGPGWPWPRRLLCNCLRLAGRINVRGDCPPKRILLPRPSTWRIPLSRPGTLPPRHVPLESP